MKKIALIALLVTGSIAANAQQWNQVNSQTTNNLTGVHFPTATVGYAAGGNTVVKTTDAGLTWHAVTGTLPPAGIMDVRFTSADTGFIVGYASGTISPTGGYIYKTTNGGTNWTLVLSNTEAPMYSVHFSSRDTGFAAGAEAGTGSIYKTTNGGNSWTEVYNNGVYAAWMVSVFATSNTKCFVAGKDYGVNAGTVWSSSNGINFTTSYPTGQNNDPFAVFFSDAQHGFVTGNSVSGDFLIKSTNGGTSWSTPISIGTNTVYGPSGIFFFGADTGYIGLDDAHIKFTANGGNSWTDMQVNTLSGAGTGKIRDMYFPDQNLGIAVGENGVILRYAPDPPNPGTPMTAVVTPKEKSACEGDKIQVNTTITNANGPVTYSWQPTTGLSCNNCANPIITTTAGINTYTETISDNVTTLTKTVSITGNPKPDVLITNTSPVSIKDGETIQLHATGASTYSWTPATYLSNSQIADPIAKPNADITYTVAGTNSFGCSATASVTVKVEGKTFFIPNAFSPNGDGLNDVFTVGGLSKDGGARASVNIFNRWGQVVFSQYGKEVKWDGTFNGKPADSGAYFYAIKLSLVNGDIKEYKGDITLIR